jgi:hypothetical protein
LPRLREFCGIYAAFMPMPPNSYGGLMHPDPMIHIKENLPNKP